MSISPENELAVRRAIAEKLAAVSNIGIVLQARILRENMNVSLYNRSRNNGRANVRYSLSNQTIKEFEMTTPKLPNDTATIKLTRGQIAIIDTEDFLRVSRYKWRAMKQKNYKGEHFVAVATAKAENGKRTLLTLHRFIMNAPKGLQVDHKNQDTLDNRKQNLRICSRSQNCGNKNKYETNTSGFKGVTFVKNRNKYQAQISYQGRRIFLGRFLTAEEAFEAYKAAAHKIYGDFARF